MKTPIQEVYENFNLMSDADFKAWMLNTDLLEKEKERLCDAYIKGGDAQYQYIIEGSFPYNTAEDWYNKTFKTKER